jgi:hypothetical protein
MSNTPRILGAVALFAACCAASTASAGVIDKTGHTQLTLTVAGDIDERCAMDAVPAAPLGDLTKPDITADADIGLHCNVPFQVHMVSLHGGLRNVAHPQGEGPYSGVRTYELTWQMPVQTPASQTIVASYSAAQLVGGQTISSQGGVAFNGAHIHLALDNPAAPGLAAGDYSETIEISISPTI